MKRITIKVPYCTRCLYNVCYECNHPELEKPREFTKHELDNEMSSNSEKQFPGRCPLEYLKGDDKK